MKKPTLVLVHGAWHTPRCWDKVIAHLEPQGFKCIVPQALFCGTPEPITSLHPCVEQLQDIISAETAAGNDVVMVCHSFGGLPASSAVKGFTAKDSSRLKSTNTGKVIGIAMVCALITPTGNSFAEYWAEGEPKHVSLAAPGENGWAKLIKDPIPTFYNDIPLEDAEKWAGELKKQSMGVFITTDVVYSGWLDVPLWYLYCDKDAAIDIAFQERMVNETKRLGAQVEVRTIDAGHSPFLSKPEATADYLSEAAAAMMK